MSRFLSWFSNPESQTAIALSALAALAMVPAAALGLAATEATGTPLVLLIGLIVVLVMLTGTTGAYFWFVVAVMIVGLSSMAGDASTTTEAVRFAVVGSSVLVVMELLRLAHLARRGGQISSAVYERVGLSLALVIGTMCAAGIAAAAFANSRTFPAWLLLTAIIVGGLLALLWGRSVSNTAKKTETQAP